MHSGGTPPEVYLEIVAPLLFGRLGRRIAAVLGLIGLFLHLGLDGLLLGLELFGISLAVHARLPQ